MERPTLEVRLGAGAEVIAGVFLPGQGDIRPLTPRRFPAFQRRATELLRGAGGRPINVYMRIDREPLRPILAPYIFLEVRAPNTLVLRESWVRRVDDFAFLQSTVDEDRTGGLLVRNHTTALDGSQRQVAIDYILVAMVQPAHLPLYHG